jgi:hypothetical protein
LISFSMEGVFWEWLGSGFRVSLVSYFEGVRVKGVEFVFVDSSVMLLSSLL